MPSFLPQPTVAYTVHARPERLTARATNKALRAQKSSDPLAALVHQARHAPVVQLPASSTAPESNDSQYGSRDTRVTDDDRDNKPESVPAKHSSNHLPAFDQPTAPRPQQAAPMPQKKIRPSRMDFETMYQKLYEWQQRYMSAHVPRYCFDAPELGAWVRYLRKQYTDQQLERWKVDRLNQLCFEWELTDQDAKWHHLYHQLRRYQLLHGTTEVDPAHSEEDGFDWSQVVWWLQKQARLLAKQKLSAQKRDMLAQLGVTLRVPKRLVTRTAQLQAMNGMERRKLRKKWKKLDQEASEKVLEQQDTERQQQQEQRRQQQQIVSRRLSLLLESGALPEDVVAQESRSSSRSRSSSNEDGASLNQQQLKYLQLAGLLQSGDNQQQQQQTEGQPHVAQQAPVNASADSSNSRGIGAGNSSSSSSRSRLPDAAAAAEVQVAAAAADGVNSSENLSSQQGQLTQSDEQQQQQTIPLPAEQRQALFYQRNRRTKRLRQQTKQEKWMAAEQQI